MQVFRFETIESTSTQAIQFLTDKVSTPFAITAKQQSAGRGQQARIWESPVGNFYLSIACAVPRERIRFLPLMTACTLAKWLETKLRIRPEIKWPNDLLLKRKKFAGILCEASWEQSRTHCNSVIGIGINIEKAPLLANSDYESECLRPWLIEDLSTEQLIDSFLEFWEKQTYENTEDLIREFERYHLPKGQIWRDRENPNELFTNEGISPEGHLIVRNISTGLSHELVSAQHSLILSSSP